MLDVLTVENQQLRSNGDLPADESKVLVQVLDGYIVAEKNGQLLVCSLKEEQRIKEFGK